MCNCRLLKLLVLAVLAFVGLAACTPNPRDSMTPVKVEIVATENGYQLLRGGEPYIIKGAGMGSDDLENFASHGGNSIRNWSTGADYQDTLALLDSAQANGVTVALCLSLPSERHGFDYNDAEAVAKRLEWVREEILKYRDHPALLAWIIGNELNHSYTNPAVYDVVNAVAEMIHELDPNHPTTTTLAEPDADVLAEVRARAPALDFISMQAYGALFGLPALLQEIEFDQPFMITEWGTVGYWEMQRTSWDIPHETTSTEKAELIRRGQDEVMAILDGQLIGSYIFLWGQKQERTPTWFGLFTENGEATEAVDVMHHIWTGAWPENRSPQVNEILLDGKGYRDNVILASGHSYSVSIDAVDSDGDSLRYHWEVKPESDATQGGGDQEQPIPNIEGVIADSKSPRSQLNIAEPGNYRLFAYVYDDQGHAAHANIPFRVEAGFRQSSDALIAGELMAIAYSGFRLGQHPDRGEGANNPSDAEILEDLQILAAHDLNLIRMYDSQESTRTTLALIRQHDLPIKVLLGAWLKAEVSNHEGCAWLDEPIPDAELVSNTLDNGDELRRVIKLANEYSDIVTAVNVGNEALVDWNDHMVPLAKMITYIRQVRAAIEQPVSTADNYEWWISDGAALAAEVDFLGVHTYPVWEGKSIDDGLSYTRENIEAVHAALPGKPIAILEAGWATTSSEFVERANETNQARYFRELSEWARATNTTVFFFEAFDEPWKGGEYDPNGAEKHWGLFKVDRTPKLVME
jgi:exo-beta-1,3-glucanase (GH17 family)